MESKGLARNSLGSASGAVAVTETVAFVVQPEDDIAAQSARLIAEMRDVAAIFERTKPQGLLYDSARPALSEAADLLEKMARYAALGRACEANGLGWYIANGEMRFQAPADVIEEQAFERGLHAARGLVDCPECGGSGFSGQGTGYGDVCSHCGGLRQVLAASPSVADQATPPQPNPSEL